MPLPDELRVNAWVDDAPVEPSGLAETTKGFLSLPIEAAAAPLHPGAIETNANWEDAGVGWGLILAENTDLTPAERATAINAPEPIQRLQKHRNNAPVLRYDPAKRTIVAALRRYYADGSQDPDLVGSARGTARGCLPRYLLIYGQPTAIPWELQYALNHVALVGRIDLEGEALDNYVTALCEGWKDASAQPNKTVVWAAYHGSADITALMLGSIAAKVQAKLAADQDIGDGAVYLDGTQGQATHEALADALADNTPGLVVTTSHGNTSPLHDTNALRADLGLLIDSDGALLDVENLLDRWEPGGAIWYAHACCSAGTAGESAYTGLFEAAGPIDTLLTGLTAAGDMVAPLPRALLGASKPLRAFVGHVEPTFDWTLRNNKTGQILTKATRDALYKRLYQPYPVALAFDEVRRQSSQLKAFQLAALQAFGQGQDTKDELLALQLTARDLESLVILGDPTAALPSL